MHYSIQLLQYLFIFKAELMKWMYKNEDRVWRDRGGRPGEETLASFMNLINPQLQHTHKPIPGLLAYNCAQSVEAKAGESFLFWFFFFLFFFFLGGALN
jgi:hypothetical protein